MRKTLPAEIMLAAGAASGHIVGPDQIVDATGWVLEYDSNEAQDALRTSLVVLAANCIQWITQIDNSGQEAA